MPTECTEWNKVTVLMVPSACLDFGDNHQIKLYPFNDILKIYFVENMNVRNFCISDK